MKPGRWFIFLANADNGKYQGAFLQFMTAVSKGAPGPEAWEGAFGKDMDAFQLNVFTVVAVAAGPSDATGLPEGAGADRDEPFSGAGAIS